MYSLCALLGCLISLEHNCLPSHNTYHMSIATHIYIYIYICKHIYMSGGNTCCCALVGIGGKLPVCPVFFLPVAAAPGAGLLGLAPGALDRGAAAAAVATAGAA